LTADANDAKYYVFDSSLYFGTIVIDGCASTFDTEFVVINGTSLLPVVSNDNDTTFTCITNPAASLVVLPYDPGYIGLYGLIVQNSQFGIPTGGFFSFTFHCF